MAHQNDQAFAKTANNIFTYATSELSQDAFLCWLCNWANYPQDEKDLYHVAMRFIQRCLPGISLQKPTQVDIYMQKYKIDVLLAINHRYMIIIEDKTFTSEHHNQISAYKKTLLEKWKNDPDGFQVKAEDIFTVYYKPIEECNINNSADIVITRQEMLEIMKPDIDNAIYLDYKQHLLCIDRKTNCWRKLADPTWSKSDLNYLYRGMFKFLESYVEGNYCWHYVSNPEGGFWCFWWYGFDEMQTKQLSEKYNCNITDIYLQIENEKIAVKLIADGAYVNMARKQLYNKISILLQEESEIFEKKRFRSGKHMTVGFIMHNGENCLAQMRKMEHVMNKLK